MSAGQWAQSKHSCYVSFSFVKLLYFLSAPRISRHSLTLSMHAYQLDSKLKVRLLSDLFILRFHSKLQFCTAHRRSWWINSWFVILIEGLFLQWIPGYRDSQDPDTHPSFSVLVRIGLWAFWAPSFAMEVLDSLVRCSHIVMGIYLFLNRCDSV